METNKIIQGDCLEVLKTFDDKSIDCVISSPAYWQLRDYGWTGQWGLEKTYQEYLEHLWMMMDEVWRVLKDTGTVWINLGDSYGAFRGKSGGGADSFERKEVGHRFNTKKQIVDRLNKGNYEKCLMLIPHRFAIGCIDRGWILRNDIIWAKRNGMPESVTDRFSKKHEFFFFFVKQQKYYFDLDGVRDEHIWASSDKRADGERHQSKGLCESKQYATNAVCYHKDGKNPGDVADFWDVPTQSSSEKHYATYNFDLIDKPIIAGCPENGIVLDPFAGTGTTLLRAIDLRRKGIGIEGKKEYCEIFNERFYNRYGMFKEII